MKIHPFAGAVICAFFFSINPCAFPQGSLTPPAAPTPTMKTLDQVEPRIPIDSAHLTGNSGSQFFINQPGSYYLTGNISGIPGANCITIVASHVTIDLNGYSLNGATGGNKAIIVSTSNGPNTDIEIRNGVITSWAIAGIDAFNAARARIIDVRVIDSGNSANNAIVTGANSEVRHCLVHNSGSPGITVGTDSTVVDSVAEGNTNNGIVAGDRCAIRNCTASGNTSAAASSYGITAGNKCSIIGCVASANTTSNGTPSGSTGGGIHAGDDALVKDCSTTQNSGDGINVGDRCQVLDSNSGVNGTGTTGSGIVVSVRSVVRHCSASANQKSGIVYEGASLIVDNTVGDNGKGGAAAGIESNGSSGSRIENNTARNNNGFGFSVASNDIVIHNYAFSNTTNYSSTSGTNFGPVQTASTAVSPFANF